MQGTRRDGGMWDGATRNKILYYVIEHTPTDTADVLCSVTHMHASSRIYTQDKIPSQLHNDTYSVFEYLLIKRDCLPHMSVFPYVLTSTAAGEFKVTDRVSD